MSSEQIARRAFLCRVAATAAALGLSAAAAAAPTFASSTNKRPNILMFLVDDMGWMDSSPYGSQYYQTPNVERLARRGMLFTDAYAANPLCSPTRASIMTGKYPARLGITTPSGHLPPQPDKPLLGEKAVKWQKVVCPRGRRYLPLEEYTLAEAFRDGGYATAFIGKWHLGSEPWWPRKQGFDINIAGGHYPGPPSYHSPYKIKTLPDGPEGEYLTDRLTDEALGYLDSSTAQDKVPFFLCFWHYAVHAPYQHKAELTERHRSRRDPRGQQNNPIMASMLQSMDESLGRVLDKLDALGIADDTIVVFTSDNGGNMYDRVEEKTPTNNHPLRGGKGTIYEGGVRVPWIVDWPGVTRPRSRCSEIVSTIDLYPTLLEMAGVAKQKESLVDGLSLVPLLRDGKKLEREALFCHFPHYIPATKNLPGVSVRQGDWKLIRFYGEGPQGAHAHELYDLRRDIGETKNLAAEHPELVRRLDAMISRHVREIDAIEPIPNPAYDPKAFNPTTDAPQSAGEWTARNDCSLSLEQGGLRVESLGGDPYLSATDIPANCSGAMIFTLRMRGALGATGQVFWSTSQAGAYHRSRSATFALKKTAGWTEYTIRLEVKGRLKSLRLDPGNAEGQTLIDWISLQRPDGKVLKRWDFDS